MVVHLLLLKGSMAGFKTQLCLGFKAYSTAYCPTVFQYEIVTSLNETLFIW